VDDEEEEDEEEELGDDGLVKGKAAGKEDEAYLRVKDIIQDLITAGRRALESKVEDFMENKGAKVLSAEEVRSWRRDADTTDRDASLADSSIRDGDEDDEDDADASFTSLDDVGPRSSTPIGGGRGNDSLRSEDEVEHSLMEGVDDYALPPPPITVSATY
jgi:hypothetical protein